MKNLKILSLLMIAITCINMGTSDEESSTPKFFHTELDRGEKSFEATVAYIGGSSLVRDINFTGSPHIDGIKQEGHPGKRIDIDFSITDVLEVIQPRYFSNGGEYTLITYKGKNGQVIENLLFPKNLVLSAKGLSENEKGLDLYWEMHKVKSITIHRQLMGK